MKPLDWWKIKPSSSLSLSRAEVLALPAGMVVIEVAKIDGGWMPILLLDGSEEERRARIWRLDQKWSRPFTFQEQPGMEPHLPKLPRLSFALTTDAVRERRKTVTRRLTLPTWWKTGRWFLGVDRIRQAGAQGLCVAECWPASREPLVAISQDEVDREGLKTTPEGFCAMFRSTTPREWDGWVWRMPFRYLEIPE